MLRTTVQLPPRPHAIRGTLRLQPDSMAKNKTQAATKTGFSAATTALLQVYWADTSVQRKCLLVVVHLQRAKFTIRAIEAAAQGSSSGKQRLVVRRTTNTKSQGAAAWLDPGRH